MTSSTVSIFENIIPDKDDIDQSELDVDTRTRFSLFSWNGQFSPQFIENLLNKYSVPDDVVYDPFSGSGTVLRECSSKNIKVYGVELNPSAYFMSKFSEISNLTRIERMEIISYFEDLLSSFIVSRDVEYDFISTYHHLPDGPLKNTAALIVILSDAYRNEFNLQTIGKQWTKIKGAILDLPYSKSPVCSYLGDSRSTTIPDKEVSLIITSPPYINVFNYHQNYRRSVEMLGFDVLKIARSEFGSNRKNRGNRFLTVVQYTIDMALAMMECIRVSKDESRIIYVVGRESNVLSTRFCNSDIIYRVATEIFKIEMILKQERHFKNRFGQIIYEDIIHFKLHDPESRLIDEETVIIKSKSIAESILTSALSYVDLNHKPLLEEAISKIPLIVKSEGGK